MSIDNEAVVTAFLANIGAEMRQALAEYPRVAAADMIAQWEGDASDSDTAVSSWSDYAKSLHEEAELVAACAAYPNVPARLIRWKKWTEVAHGRVRSALETAAELLDEVSAQALRDITVLTGLHGITVDELTPMLKHVLEFRYAELFAYLNAPVRTRTAIGASIERAVANYSGPMDP